jgi:hypothetical protein
MLTCGPREIRFPKVAEQHQLAANFHQRKTSTQKEASIFMDFGLANALRSTLPKED